MKIHQVRAKIMAASRDRGATPFDQSVLIPVFHRWIRESRLGPELLIDVADYRHVPDGPGVMIIGDQADYGLDEGGDGLGMAYRRKRDDASDPATRFTEALRAVLTACVALEGEPSLSLRFDPGRLELGILSRLVAPNTAETYDALRPIASDLLAGLYGAAEITLRHIDDPRKPFAIAVEASGDHTCQGLLDRLPAS